MAKLIYSGITSLDGYVADEDGSFEWAEPDELELLDERRFGSGVVHLRYRAERAAEATV